MSMGWHFVAKNAIIQETGKGQGFPLKKSCHGQKDIEFALYVKRCFHMMHLVRTELYGRALLINVKNAESQFLRDITTNG